MANVLIQLKRGKQETWEKQNPTLAYGEPGYEKETGKLKIGNGITAWNELPYLAGGATSWADLGEGIITTVLADNQVFSTAEHDGEAAFHHFTLKQGATYDVVYQGVSYIGIPAKTIQLSDGLTYTYIGNLALGEPGVEDTGEDFVIVGYDSEGVIVPKEPAENITLSLTEHAPGVLPLPQKYAPEIKRFYCNRVGGDLPQWHGYLYLDKECTIKASKADLIECRTAFCLVGNLGDMDSTNVIHYPLYVMYSDKYDYAGCVTRIIDTDYTFVTSEYVPE